MAQGTLAPSPKLYGWNPTTGAPLAGGLLYTMAAGGSYPTDALTTFTDVDLNPSTHANTNPIVLNSAGYCVIYLTPGLSYKFILKTSAGVTVWSQDNIKTVPNSSGEVDVTGTAGENITAEDVVYLSAGDGSRNAGEWYKADADLGYASSEAGTIALVLVTATAGNTTTFRIGGKMDITSTSLNPGSKYYVSGTAGALSTSASLLNTRYVGEANGVNSIVLAPNPPQAEQLNFIQIQAFC